MLFENFKQKHKGGERAAKRKIGSFKLPSDLLAKVGCAAMIALASLAGTAYCQSSALQKRVDSVKIKNDFFREKAESILAKLNDTNIHKDSAAAQAKRQEARMKTHEARKELALSLFSGVLGNKISDVRLALANGADVNARDETTGTTPLMDAALLGYADIVKLLIGKGADVNAMDKNGATALRYAKAFEMTSGETGMVGLLKAHGAKE
jgi:hypothetical protein